MSKLIKLVKTSYIYKKLVYKYLKYRVNKNPILEINRYYNFVFGRNADLENPRSLIEKIYWMQLNLDTSMWTLCSDKYRVRHFIHNLGLSEYLPKLYGCWSNPYEIDFEKLPQSFVLKLNNGCGSVILVKNKSIIDQKKIIKQLLQWLKIPFGYSGFEPHYLKINPCILAEELLIQGEEQNNFSPFSIVDYKVWCINGIPESIFVGYNRTSNKLSMALFDIEWNSLSEKLLNTDCDTYYPETIIPRPLCLSKMLEMAQQISSSFPECRVDFYIVDNQPVIGEMTFSSGYGYFTEEYYNYLGDKIDLSSYK